MFLFQNKSKVFFVSAIIGILYSIYIVLYFAGAVGDSSGAEQVGAAIATALVLPHMILVILATLFNIIGFFLNSKGFAIATGVLYCVAGVLFLPYIFFVIPSIVLSFIGVSKIGKIKANDKSSNAVAQ